MMKNTEEKEKDKSATDWLTRPIYKILIVGLVILELLKKEIDEGTKQFIDDVLWIGLGLIVIINVANIFLFFKKNSKPQEENKVQPEEDEE